MVADLHERGYKFLAYANPFVDPALPNHFDEMAEMGLLMQDAEGEPYLFTAPNTRPADEGGGAVAAHPDLMPLAPLDAARRPVLALHALLLLPPSST